MKKTIGFPSLAVVVIIFSAACNAPLTNVQPTGEMSAFSVAKSIETFGQDTGTASVYVTTGQQNLGLSGECQLKIGTIVTAMTKTVKTGVFLVEVTTSPDAPQHDYCLVSSDNLRLASKTELADFVVTNLERANYFLPGTENDVRPSWQTATSNYVFPALVIVGTVAGWGGSRLAQGTKGAAAIGDVSVDGVRFAEAGRAVSAKTFAQGMGDGAIRSAFSRGVWEETAERMAKSTGLAEDELATLKNARTAEDAIQVARGLNLAERVTAGSMAEVKIVIAGEEIMAISHPAAAQGSETYFNFARGAYSKASKIPIFGRATEVPALNLTFATKTANPRVEQALAKISKETAILPELRAQLKAFEAEQRAANVAASVAATEQAAQAKLLKGALSEIGAGQAAQAKLSNEIFSIVGRSSGDIASLKGDVAGLLRASGLAEDEKSTGQILEYALKAQQNSVPKQIGFSVTPLGMPNTAKLPLNTTSVAPASIPAATVAGK